MQNSFLNKRCLWVVWNIACRLRSPRVTQCWYDFCLLIRQSGTQITGEIMVILQLVSKESLYYIFYIIYYMPQSGSSLLLWILCALLHLFDHFFVYYLFQEIGLDGWNVLLIIVCLNFLPLTDKAQSVPPPSSLTLFELVSTVSYSLTVEVIYCSYYIWCEKITVINIIGAVALHRQLTECILPYGVCAVLGQHRVKKNN